jgi:hypothetical protein
MALNAIFTIFFDIIMIKIGYIYVYFTLLFFTLVLYLFYSWLHINWLGVFSFGLCGIIGIPIDMWQEWFVENTLKSPWGAVGWGGIFILYGLVADLSMLSVEYWKGETKAILFSSFIFSLGLLIISLIPLSFFYKETIFTTAYDTYVTYWYFLFPFGIIEGIIGAYAGKHIGQEIRKRTKKNAEQKIDE